MTRLIASGSKRKSSSKTLICAFSGALLMSGFAVGGMQESASATSGDELWSQRYAGPSDSWDSASAVAVSHTDGRVYVTGTSSEDFLTVAYGSSGAPLWQRSYGQFGQTDYAHDIAVSPNGSKVFVTGESYNDRGDADFATIAYRRDGTRLWTRLFDGNAKRFGHDRPSALATSPDGHALFVTGTSRGAGTVEDFATVAYRSDGRHLWTRRLDGPTSGPDLARDLAVGGNGRKVFVTGASQGGGNGYDFVTVSYRADGAQLWVRRYDGPQPRGGADDPVGIATSVFGDKVFVTGDSPARGSGSDIAVVAYRTDGTPVWLRRYDSKTHARDSAAGIAVHPDGRGVVVTGSSGRRGDSDYVTMAFRGSGGRMWSRRFDGPKGARDVATAIAASLGGSVVVTGLSRGAGNAGDYRTVGYGADGAQRWVSRYDGATSSGDHNEDVPAGLTLTADGSTAVVTGSSSDLDHGSDYATVAYAIE